VTDGEERTDLEVLDLGGLDFSESYVARAPRAPEAVPTQPTQPTQPEPAQKPRRSRRRIVVALVAAIVVVAAGTASLLDRDGDDEQSSPEPTIGLGSGTDTDGETEEPAGAEPRPLDATVLATGEDGAHLVNLDTGKATAVDGLPAGPVEIVDETDGVVVVRAGTPSAIYRLDETNDARRLDVDAAAAAADDRVWLARGRELWPSDDPDDRSPMPANHRLVAATTTGVLLQGPDGKLLAIEPGVSGSASRTTIPGAAPRVLDVSGNRVAWVESSCSDPCDLFVSDIADRVTARIPLDRPVDAVAISPSGASVAVVARDGRIAFVGLIGPPRQGISGSGTGGADGDPGGAEFLNAGAAPAGRVAWRTDGRKLFVPVADPPRVLVFDPRDSDVEELPLDDVATGLAWVGASAVGEPVAGTVTNPPALHGTRFPLVLGEPSGVDLAWVDGGDLHVLDLDSGRERTVPGPVSSRVPMGVAAAGDGWLVTRPGSAIWYPPGGERVRLDGGADWTIPDAATGRVFLVRYGARDTARSGIDLRVFDPAAGSLSEPVRVFLDPVGAVDGGVLFGAPPDLDRPSTDLVWLDVATGERRDIASPAQDAYPLGAGGGRIVWRRGECGADCPVIVTDAHGAVASEAQGPAGGADTASISPDGRYVLVSSWASGGATLVDLETGERREVPADVTSWPVGWSRSGWFVFGTSDAGIGAANRFRALTPGSGDVHEIGDISADMLAVR
jgi:hypothetical protein